MDKDCLSQQPIFSLGIDLGEREWGSETLIHLAEGKWSMKKLFIKAGSKGGLQYHRLKNEASFLVKGKLIIRFYSGERIVEKILTEGESVHFPPQCIHQEEAISDCILIEVSTPIKMIEVRVEKEFNIKDISGLPSTEKKDIEEIKLKNL